MLGLMHMVTVMDNLRRYPLLVSLAHCIPWVNSYKCNMIQFSKDKTAAYEHPFLDPVHS
jgi:hypothetical protein